MNKFVLSVIVDGTPRKELANGTVPIPFNSEYALKCRNKNNRRAVVKLYIDGENVSGNGYVVPANDFIEIERHGDVNKRFKFVSLDSDDAIDYGKNGANEDKVKGVIEARYYFEKEYVAPPIVIHQWPLYTPPVEVHHHHHRDGSVYGGIISISSGGCYNSANNASWSASQNSVVTGACASTSGSINTTINTAPRIMSRGLVGGASAGIPKGATLNNCLTEQSFDCDEAPRTKLSFKKDGTKALSDGCTVEGAISQQRFSTTWIDLEETYVSVKVFLQGYDPEKEVEKVRTPKPASILSTIMPEDMTVITPTQQKIKDLEDEIDQLKIAALEKEREELKSKLEA